MITLKIPIVLILKILLRVWQVLGLMMVFGFVLTAVFIEAEYCTVYMNKLNKNLLMFAMVGNLALFADWFNLVVER
jgi:hypothetical protein